MLGLLSTLLLAPAANAYFILSHQPLVQTRLDPIISPGQISQHEHTIVGGSAFSQNYDYDTSLTSNCTTAPVNIDFSNYWAPSLFYYDPSNSTYQAIPAGEVKTYYLQRPGDKNEKIVAPPAGLQMVAGNPYRRSFNESSFADQAISFVCLDYYNSHSGDPSWDQRNNFFEHNCPDGMRAQVNFPQCWDGKRLKSDDMSHVAYPIDTMQGGNCPSTHPVHMVMIFTEFIFNVGDFPFNPQGEITWVLANGDTTGYGFHADFTMGWPTEGEHGNVLQDALDTCGLETGGDINACDVFKPFIDNTGGCKPEMPVVDEPNGLGYTIPKLPGNNPLWIGNSTTKPSYPNYVETAGYKAVHSTLPAGWENTGCVAEAQSGRALTAAGYTSSDSMTLATCAAYCDKLKLPYAGVEYGRECYCDSVFRNKATGDVVGHKNCSITCTGLNTEDCGGASYMTLLTNSAYVVNETTLAAELPDGWTAGPCITDSTSSRSLKGGYIASSKSMTNQMCINYCQSKGFTLAGTVYGQECYCSNEITSTASVADESTCSMTCKGDIRQTCGGSSRMSLFVSTNATSTSADDYTIVDGRLAKFL